MAAGSPGNPPDGRRATAISRPTGAKSAIIARIVAAGETATTMSHPNDVNDITDMKAASDIGIPALAASRIGLPCCC